MSRLSPPTQDNTIQFKRFIFCISDTTIKPTSEAINAGTATYSFQNKIVLNIQESDYIGVAPDLGAVEYGSVNSVIENNNNIPLKIMLYQNYPNPFNPRTIVNYKLPITNYVELIIYNPIGQMIAILVSKKQSAGSYQVEWDASGFASGIYYYMIRAGDFRALRKMILLRQYQMTYELKIRQDQHDKWGLYLLELLQD